MANREMENTKKQPQLIISTSPHIKSGKSISKIMWTVFLTLIPAGIAGIFLFGIRSLYIIAVSILTALITEGIILFLRKGKVSSSLLNGSAVLTGLLLAYNLPPGVPLWIPALGSFVAIAIGKQVFGGLGHNIFNPALIGRAFLLASFPTRMTTWSSPFGIDVVSGATPLAMLKDKGIAGFDYWDLFIGNCGGCIGETSKIILLAGALILLYKKYITWHIPFVYILTTALFTWIFGGKQLFAGDWLYHILGGGLFLGAFFMATDMVTTPLTKKGMFIFGFGCGLLTAIIRLWGGYPEGVSYSILLMNGATPLIDRFTRPRRFGLK